MHLLLSQENWFWLDEIPVLIPGVKTPAKNWSAFTGPQAFTGPGQSQKNPVGASALPTGKFLRVRKVFARINKIGSKSSQNKFLDSLEI